MADKNGLKNAVIKKENEIENENKAEFFTSIPRKLTTSPPDALTTTLPK